jgi:hypothetical protein
LQKQSSGLETSVVVVVVERASFFLAEYHEPKMKLFVEAVGVQVLDA